MLISAVVTFQAQNRETINSRPILEKLLCPLKFKIIMTTSIMTMFHNTTSDLQDQDQDRFLPAGCREAANCRY